MPTPEEIAQALQAEIFGAALPTAAAPPVSAGNPTVQLPPHIAAAVNPTSPWPGVGPAAAPINTPQASQAQQSKGAQPQNQQNQAKQNQQPQQKPQQPPQQKGGGFPGFGGGLPGTGGAKPKMGGGKLRMGGYNGDTYVRPWVVFLYRIGALLASLSGYVVAGALQAVLWKRIIPDDLLGRNAAWVLTAMLTVFVTLYVNAIETAYRNADNDTRDIHWAGWFAYVIDFAITLLSLLTLRGFAVDWLPSASGNHVPMNWLDWVMTLIVTILLTWGCEPLLEYGTSGQFRIFGKRFME